MMNLPKPPALLQDLVLLENGDLRHKQREHVSNLYHVCSAKQIAKKKKRQEGMFLSLYFLWFIASSSSSSSDGVWMTSLALSFFLGGIDEDNGLIPSRVANLCGGLFLSAAANGLGCRKREITEIAPCA